MGFEYGRQSGILRRRKAFTLVEALGAIVIGGLVVVAASTALVQMERTRHAAQEKIEQQWRLERVFETLESDISNIVGWLPATHKAIVKPTDEGALLELICLVLFVENGHLYPRKLPARVVYSVEVNANDGKLRLLRSVWNLTSLDEEPAYGEVLAKDLSQLRMRYFVDNEWSGPAIEPRKTELAISALSLECAWENPELKGKRLIWVDTDATS